MSAKLLLVFACFLHFSLIYCFHFLYANYRHPFCLNYTLLLLHLVITHLVIDFIITMYLSYVLGNYYELYKYRSVCTNQLTWERSLHDWNASLEKSCNFYLNNSLERSIFHLVLKLVKSVIKVFIGYFLYCVSVMYFSIYIFFVLINSFVAAKHHCLNFFTGFFWKMF